MSTKILKRKVLAGAASFVVMFSLLSASHAHANSSLRSEMNKMFGSMSNATTPGAYESTRRGGITGGSLVVRNKIMNTNIVGFQPPSFNGGCGGIDMFGGSFSFINKEQFIQLLRSIASNASSYAFYLALEAMAPSVRATMDNIQEKIQQFNQFFGNSCQLAQGIRTDPAAAFEKAREVTAGLGKSIQEGAGDIFETFTGTSGSAPTEGISLATKNKVSGNVVWKSLKEKGVASWFTYGGDNLNMAIMTITGTVIIGPDAPAPDGQGNSPEITTIPGNGISLKDMIDGGDVFVLSCGSDTEHCLNPDPKKMTSAELVGFRRMVMDMLLGNGSDPGIISKLRQGVEPHPGRRRLLQTFLQAWAR